MELKPMTCRPDNVAEFNEAPVGTLPAGVQPVWGIRTSVAENLQITALFTVVSIARGYLWRRVFNAIARRPA